MQLVQNQPRFTLVFICIGSPSHDIYKCSFSTIENVAIWAWSDLYQPNPQLM